MNFLARCWQRRWIRGLASTAVTFLTLCALFYSWVNWSGARQWRMAQAMLKAEGETLDFRALCNDPIPEAENFCAIPPLKDVALVVDNDEKKGEPAEKRKRLEVFRLDSSPRQNFSNDFGPLDLKPWADSLRKNGMLPASSDSGDPSRDVLAGLAKQDALVEELAAGLDRPKAQWTPEWKTRDLPANHFTISLPHLTFLMSASNALKLRAIAAARTGDAARAHKEALIIACLAQAALNDPVLISALVGVSAASQLESTTWELCYAHVGTVEDFAKLEASLMGLDLQRAMLSGLRCEMVCASSIVQLGKNNRDSLFETCFGSLQDWNSKIKKFFFYAVPAGFFEANAAALVDFEFKYLIQPLRDGGLMQAHESAQDAEKQISAIKKKIWAHPSYWSAAKAVSPLSGPVNRLIYGEVSRNQAVIACALERYRIENGSYPDSLEGVKLANGNPLPLDIINEKPMNYRKTADGRYALWSIGFDGKDDSGQRGATDQANPPKTRLTDASYQGDWVWDFPSN